VADRKQFAFVTPPDEELVRLLDLTRDDVPTEETLREQRVSFAFGNAMNVPGITRESVQHASKNIRLLP